MDKDGLLKSIAETGYNVGFGAKKHFATYDIIEKMPGIIGFLSIAIGVYSLVFEALSAKVPSASLTVAGVCSLYISFYEHRKFEYEKVGKELTQLFIQLRSLYRSVQAGGNLATAADELQKIETQFNTISISNQALLSDWYAHYKFFAQQQIEWIDEVKHFTWRDRFPLSFIVTASAIALVAVIWVVTLLAPCFAVRGA